MRIGRSELLLVAGLAAALVVAFSGQVTTVLVAIRDFEARHHIELTSGLAIAAVVLLGFIVGKRRQLQRRSTADIREARERARRLERLVTFWQALAESADFDTTRTVLEQHLPDITGSGEVWVVAGDEDGWRVLFGPETVHTDHGPAPVVDLAHEVLSTSAVSARPDGVDVRGQVCFAMVAAGAGLGVLGLPAASPALAPERRLGIGATVALLGVALNSLRLVREVRETSLRDDLTGCTNRAHAVDHLKAELARAKRTRQPLSLIMFDVDRFKSINDRHGHLCGDAVLRGVGAVLKSTLRTSDVKSRYGGEEFLILLPETPIEGARHAADLLRDELSKLEVPWGPELIHVTGSFGVACARPGELDPATLIGRADEALYRAKREGRDRVRVAADGPASEVESPIAIGDEPGR
jgi:diguanylate cyclase (GGDEF)-like protein